ncbi:MAG: hypothetical protein AAGA43_16740 [Bacteroidota bacterium]
MKILMGLPFFVIGIIIFSPKKQNDDKVFLGNKLIELESYFKYRDSLDYNVSQVPVAWHLDHSLRTINEISKTIKKSNPEEYRGSINLGRSMLLLTKSIPRGRAEAPKIVAPPDTISIDSLHFHLNEARVNLNAYDSLPKKAFFVHPYLGRLKKKTAKKFIEIHTEHHLKIIRDIMKK